jgi:hypothetical protein
VVRRLVEQQQIGFGEEQARERDAHLPPAREAVERLLLHFLVETQADQDARRARRGGIGVDRVQPLVDFAEPVGVVSGLAFRRGRSGAFGIGGEHGLERRRRCRSALPARYSRRACRAACRCCRRRDRAGRSSPSSAWILPAPLRPISPTRLFGGRLAVARSRIGAPAKAYSDSVDRQHGRAPSMLRRTTQVPDWHSTRRCGKQAR